jgi:hypothetical protein
LSLLEENPELRKLKEKVITKLAKLLTVKFAISNLGLKEAIIDGGLQLNLLSAILAKEQGLQVNSLPELLVEGVGGFKLPVYGTIEANVTITDSRGRV